MATSPSMFYRSRCQNLLAVQTAKSSCIESKKKNMTRRETDAPSGKHSACIVSNVWTSDWKRQEHQRIKKNWALIFTAINTGFRRNCGCRDARQGGPFFVFFQLFSLSFLFQIQRSVKRNKPHDYCERFLSLVLKYSITNQTGFTWNSRRRWARWRWGK